MEAQEPISPVQEPQESDKQPAQQEPDPRNGQDNPNHLNSPLNEEGDSQRMGQLENGQLDREEAQQEEKKQVVKRIKDGIDNNGVKKDKMGTLLKHAEYYANFLLSHHQSARKSNEMNNSKRRGRFEEEDEQERQFIEQEQENGSTHTHLEKQPSILKGGQLKYYQLIGLNWLISLYESGINGILADDMGLGKTIQTIAIISFLKQFKKIDGPHMIIAPKITLGNWVRQFQKWLPSCKVVKLIATKQERLPIVENIISKGAFDVVVTSFQGVRLCLKDLRRIKWRYLVIDEAHKIKNQQSTLSQVVRSLNTKNKLLLTGTPLQNNLHQLWSLLNFIMPDIFDSSQVFDEWFTINNNETEPKEQLQRKNVEMIQQLHKILRAFMLRRTKKEVEKSLPQKKEVHVLVGLTELQVRVYRNLLQKRNPSEDQKKYYLNLLIQLRKVCNHPYLFPGVQEEGAPVLGEHIIQTSGKMRVLDSLLNKLSAEKHQVLIFSQMTMMLDILQDYCNFRNYEYCRIDGSTDMDSRDRQINQFQEEGSTKFIFLLSTRAGGLGINLTSADTVIIYDSDWNPQMDLQAMDRAHRIGQKNMVNVYRMITENTVQQKMIQRQAIKLKWDSLVIQQGRVATQKNKILSKEEMKDLLQFGANVIFKAQNGTYSEQMIDQLLKRGEEQTKQMNDQIDKKVQEHANLLNLGMNSINIFQFMDPSNKEDVRVLDEMLACQLDKEGRLTRREKTKGANYNLEIGKNGKPDKKLYKKVVVPQYHFYQEKDLLTDLLQKEEDYQKFRSSDPSLQPLTQEEQIKKEELLATGYRDWSKQDFHNFIQSCEKNSLSNIDEISKAVGKSAQEVQEYAKTFASRIDQLSEKDKLKKQIQAGQERVASKKHHHQLLEWKGLQGYQIDFNSTVYTKFRSKQFTIEADRYLVQRLFKLGMANISAVRECIRKQSMFRFDQFFRSRTQSELNRRMQSLYKLIQKERDISINGVDLSMIKDKESKRQKKANKLRSKLDQVQENLDQDSEEVKQERQTKPEKQTTLKFTKRPRETIQITEDD